MLDSHFFSSLKSHISFLMFLKIFFSPEPQGSLKVTLTMSSDTCQWAYPGIGATEPYGLIQNLLILRCLTWETLVFRAPVFSQS